MDATERLYCHYLDKAAEWRERAKTSRFAAGFIELAEQYEAAAAELVKEPPPTAAQIKALVDARNAGVPPPLRRRKRT